MTNPNLHTAVAQRPDIEPRVSARCDADASSQQRDTGDGCRMCALRSRELRRERGDGHVALPQLHAKT